MLVMLVGREVVHLDIILYHYCLWQWQLLVCLLYIECVNCYMYVVHLYLLYFLFLRVYNTGGFLRVIFCPVSLS